MGDLFGGGSQDPQPLEPQWQIDMRERLARQAEPIGSQYINSLGGAYAGNLTAAPTAIQNTSFQAAQNASNQPLASQSNLYGMGQSEIEKVLAGDYNPEDSLYYESFKKALQRELQSSQDALANRSSARDQFFGGGRLDQERNLQTDYLNNIGMVLGQLQEAERQRMFQAAPIAAQMAQFNAQDPYLQSQLQFQTGELQRQLQQQMLDRQYNDFLRQQQERAQGLQTATGLATYQPPYYVAQPADSGLGGLLGGVLGAAGQAGGFGNLLGLGAGAAGAGALAGNAGLISSAGGLGAVAASPEIAAFMALGL